MPTRTPDPYAAGTTRRVWFFWAGRPLHLMLMQGFLFDSKTGSRACKQVKCLPGQSFASKKTHAIRPQPSPPTHGSQSADDSHVKAKEMTEKNSKVQFGMERDFEPRLAGTAQLVFLKFICKLLRKLLKFTAPILFSRMITQYLQEISKFSAQNVPNCHFVYQNSYMN